MKFVTNTTAGAGSGTLFQVTGNGSITPTLASISNTSVMTTTGKLLDLTANSATTTTGLLTLNASGLTSGWAVDINVNGTTAMTTGGAIDITGPTGAANQSTSGLLRITSTGATTGTAGSGNLLQLSTGTVTGTAASITGTAAMTTTGNLLTLTANSATTAAGILRISTNALTSGNAFTIASSSTAMTGALQNITLSGSNAANTGNLLRLVDSGAANTSTPLYVSGAGAATQVVALIENTGSGTSFRVNDAASDTTPFLIDASGNVGIGTTTPSSKVDITTNSLGTTQTNTSGIVLVNTTAATDGNQQISPALRFRGYGFDPSPADASRSMDFRMFVNPVQSLSIIDSYLTFQSTVDDGVYSDRMVITNGGNVGIGTTTPTSRLTATDGTYTVNLADTANDIGISVTDGAFLVSLIDNAAIGAYITDGGDFEVALVDTNNNIGASITDGFYVVNLVDPNNGAVASFLNGNVGIGTATPATLFELYGTGSADAIATLTAPDATYDPLLKFRTGASPAVQFTLGVDNSDGDKFKIYSGDGLGGDEFVIDSNGVTTIANLNLGASAFDEDGGALSWIDMSVTAAAPITTVESYSAMMDGNSFLTIYAESDGSGGITTTASAVKADVQLDATADGLATKVVAGNCSDSNFNRDIDGLLCIDSTGGSERLYFREGGSWNYIAKTGGFQIPNYETAPMNKLTDVAQEFLEQNLDDISHYPEYLTKRLKPGELLIPYVDNYLADGAVHGLYARFDDVKTKMFAEEQTQIANLTLQTNQNVTTLAELQVSVDDQLVVVGNSLNAVTTKLAEHDAYFASDMARLDTLDTLVANFGSDMSNQVARTTLLESQIGVLTEQVSTLAEFYTTFDMGAFVAADAEGNVSLEGRLKATIVESEGLVIEVVDAEAPTIGTVEILPEAIDTDNDGKDDYTGLSMTDETVLARNGKEVDVLTKAMIPMVNGSRVFTTFKDNPSAFSWVEKLLDDEGDYIGFRIHVSEKVTTKVKVDWLLVEQKDSFAP